MVNIEHVRYDDYYDLHVPGWNHYEAHGVWHHNSGKSAAGAIWSICQAEQRPEERGLILANSFPQLYQSTLIALVEACRRYNVPLEPWADAAEEQAIKIANMRRCYLGTKGTFVRVLSMGSFHGKSQSSRGQEVQWAWLDEGAYTPEQAFQTLDGRLRSSFHAFCRGLITTSPNGFNWLYRRFGDPSRAPDLKRLYYMIRLTTRENATNLGEDYVASLEANYTDELIQQELEGMFINSTIGLVFKYFKRDVHALRGEDAELIAYDPTLPLHIAFDFNYSPAICVFSQVKGQELHVFDEIYMMDSDIWELVSKVSSKIDAGKPRNEDLFIYGDASGRNRTIHSRQSAWDVIKDGLRKTGLVQHWRVPKANPPVKNRVNSTNCLLMKKRFYIDIKKCPETVKDLEETTWGGEGIDKSDALRTHLMDATSYQIEWLFPYREIQKPSAGKGQIVGVPG